MRTRTPRRLRFRRFNPYPAKQTNKTAEILLRNYQVDLDYKGTLSLFRCFLTAICLCIQEKSQERQGKRSSSDDFLSPKAIQEAFPPLVLD
jgi:hypothetical protein